MQESKIPNYIAIEGPIGVGKTSLSRKIAMDFGHELCLEESDAVSYTHLTLPTSRSV